MVLIIPLLYAILKPMILIIGVGLLSIFAGMFIYSFDNAGKLIVAFRCSLVGMIICVILMVGVLPLLMIGSIITGFM